MHSCRKNLQLRLHDMAVAVKDTVGGNIHSWLDRLFRPDPGMDYLASWNRWLSRFIRDATPPGNYNQSNVGKG